MDLSVKELCERYSRLSDDELAELAIRNELIPKARQCLDKELKLRGINNLDTYKAKFEHQVLMRKEYSKERVEKTGKNLSLWLKLTYAISGLVAIIGVYKLTLDQNQDSGLFILVMGALGFPFFWIVYRLIMLVWKVIFRP